MSHARVTAAEIERAIRNIPDFPKPGIQFKDITPVLGDARLFAGSIDLLLDGIKPGSVDAVKPGQRVILVDDLLATGGTAAAATSLLQRIGAEIVEVSFLIELSFLNGRQRLRNLPLRSLVVY
jgi:adenine phosphoribosyltransferase